MASFVREVLSAAGQLSEKEDFNGKALKLKNRVDSLKFQMREKIESRYEDFSASFVEVSTSVNQLEDVLKDIDALEHSINSHIKAGLIEIGRDSSISRQLEELTQSVRLAKLTKMAFENVEEAAILMEKKQYLETAVKLKSVEKITNDILRPASKSHILDEEKNTEHAMKAIRMEHDSIKQKLCYVLGQDWDQNVKIIPDFEEGSKHLLSTRVELNFKIGDQNLERLVKAMAQSDILSYRQQKFTKNLFLFVILPIITKPCKLEDKEMSIILKINDKSDHQPNNPQEILNNLETIFIFLSSLFKFSMDDDERNPEVFISQIGKNISKDTIDTLMKQCLLLAVPDTKSGLEGDFVSLLVAVRAFHASLLEIKLFNENEAKVLLDYVDNINETFVNQRCQSLLGQARILMKKDLHVAEKIEDSSSKFNNEDMEEMLRTKTNTNLKLDMNVEEELLPLPEGMALNDGLFKFPSCQVSQSIIELKNLLENVMNEALEAPKEDGGYLSKRLLLTARNIFEMYNDVLPMSHRESLKKYPLDNALAYNNCMFLAHECLQIFVPIDKLPESLKQRPLTFADLVPKLRQTGVEIFMEQMKSIKDEFQVLLRDPISGFGKFNGSDIIPQSSEKCLNSILQKMFHLKSLWQDTLPLSNYRRSIGAILNAILEELVQTVIGVEDIAKDSATQITMLFSIVLDQVPNLFWLENNSQETFKEDVVRYVKKWNRFKELIVILKANMREIEDRWTSGKGPLANEFKAEEIRRLVRALFQNTDKRAEMLTRIR